MFCCADATDRREAFRASASARHYYVEDLLRSLAQVQPYKNHSKKFLQTKQLTVYSN